MIDDWDFPIRDIEHEELKELHRFLLSFYIVTKGCDEYIKFCFATGIHLLIGDMLFGFNHFSDISLEKRYGNICGFTKKELTQLNIQNSKFNIIDNWYNGYYFLKDRVYNPYQPIFINI